VTARREFGGAIAVCVVGAALVLLALRPDWARVDYHAPAPLPSGSVPVTGQDLLSAVSALALAALACLAAIIATRGVARRAAGAVLAGLGAWIAVLVTEPITAASVIAAAAGSASSGGVTGSGPGGTSAISGNSTTGGGLPVLGTATRVALTSGPWQVAAVAGAVLVVAAGLVAAWHGPRWAVMSGRFDRPGQQATGPQEHQGLQGTQEHQGPQGPQEHQKVPAAPEAEPAPRHPDGDAAALWEALDRGVDLTEPGQDAAAIPAAARGDDPAAARGDDP
jgi:hypothetical protein